MISSLFNNMLFLLTEMEIVYPEGYEGPPIEFDTGSTPAWPSALAIGLCVLLAAVCVGLMVIILLQKKRASGIGAAIAGSGETYWSKNKGKSVEGSLEKYTKWGGAAFILIALLINILI